MDDKERKTLERNMSELDECLGSAVDYLDRLKYGDAICALEDLADLIGKIIPSLEKLEDEGS